MTNPLTGQVAAAPRTAPERFWITRAGYGLLLGAAIAILEFVYYVPLAPVPDRIGVDSFVILLLVWCSEGVVLTLVLGFAERQVHPRELAGRRLALAVVAGVIAGVLTGQSFSHLFLREVLAIRLFTDHIGQPVVWMGGVLYHAWMMFFFGGLTAAVYAARRRHVRMQVALRAAELGYATSQQRLAEAGLASLQERVAPDFLLQTLTRLEQLYESDPDAADRLLDELIVFLRGALADIRASATAMPRYAGMQNLTGTSANTENP